MSDSDKTAVQTRRRLLRAASEIIRRDGVRHVTLDRVAKEAHVSKGGLLYHFPSKEALMQGLVAHMMDLFSERLDFELTNANEPDGTPGRWLRAYLRATFGTGKDEYDLSAALTVIIAEEPTLMSTLQLAFQQFASAGMQDGLPTELATMIRLAADGLWFGEALQVPPLDAEHRQIFLAYLLQLTYPPNRL